MTIQPFLAGIVQFASKEKFYVFLLVAVLLVYGFLVWPAAGKREPSPAIEKIKIAEKTLREKTTDARFIQSFLERNRVGQTVVALFTLFFFLAFCAGLMFDFLFLRDRRLGRTVIERVATRGDPLWGFSDLVKILILVAAFGLGASFYLSFLRELFFPKMSNNVLILLHTTLNDLAAVGFIAYFVVKKYGGKLNDIGINFIGWNKDIFIGVIGYVATLPIFFIVLVILVVISALTAYEPPPHPLVEVFVEETESAWTIGYSILLAVVIGPAIEEIFFRGFCYPVLRKRWGVPLAMMVTAAFFALTHQSVFAFWPIFVLGLVLAYLYEKRGTLVPCITMHIVHNSIFIGYFFVVKKVFLDQLMSLG